jgi:hypothetical protein
LAREHERFAGAILRLLHARSHHVNAWTFPMEFTYYNDLSLEYLAPKVLDEQLRLIATAKSAAGSLSGGGDHEAQRLVEKLLASLREYTSILQELLAPHRLAPLSLSSDGTPDQVPTGSARRARHTKTVAAEPQTAA